jgi:hypothetical protein
MRYDETSAEFDVARGDTVLVRVRKHGDSGSLRAKFVGTVEGFQSPHEMLADKVVIDAEPLGTQLRFANYEVELEQIDAESEVNF